MDRTLLRENLKLTPEERLGNLMAAQRLLDELAAQRLAQAADLRLPNGARDGSFPAMKTTIDSAGRLVIPRELRRAAGLEPGMALEVRLEGGVVMVEPAPTPVVLERRGRFVVARPVRPGPVLTEQTVRETRERLQAERGATRGRTQD